VASRTKSWICFVASSSLAASSNGHRSFEASIVLEPAFRFSWLETFAWLSCVFSESDFECPVLSDA